MGAALQGSPHLGVHNGGANLVFVRAVHGERSIVAAASEDPPEVPHPRGKHVHLGSTQQQGCRRKLSGVCEQARERAQAPPAATKVPGGWPCQAPSYRG